GWTVTPVGKHVTLTDLPLNILPLADSKHVLVATSGFNKHELSLIDLTTQKINSSEMVRQSWFGLALTPGEDKVWWAGGGANMLHTFDLKDGKLTRTSTAEIDPAKLTKEERDKLKEEMEKKKAFKAGLCLDAKKQVLYSLDIDNGTLTPLDLKTGEWGKAVPCGIRPHDLVLGRDGIPLFRSDSSRPAVVARDPE